MLLVLPWIHSNIHLRCVPDHRKSIPGYIQGARKMTATFLLLHPQAVLAPLAAGWGWRHILSFYLLKHEGLFHINHF
jgi:hypothetical protein